FGAMRGPLTSLNVSYNTFPIGNSKRAFPPLRRTIASLFPSGAQLASWTSSVISRGAPPAMETLAKVGAFGLRSSPMASSPYGETEKRMAVGTPMGRDSGLPRRAEKIWDGLPSQRAAYMTVWPSGANLAVPREPLRKVRRWNTGAEGFAPEEPMCLP